MIKQAIGYTLVGAATSVIALFLLHIAHDIGWKALALVIAIPCSISAALRAGFYLIGDKGKEGAKHE